MWISSNATSACVAALTKHKEHSVGLTAAKLHSAFRQQKVALALAHVTDRRPQRPLLTLMYNLLNEINSVISALSRVDISNVRHIGTGQASKNLFCSRECRLSRI